MRANKTCSCISEAHVPHSSLICIFPLKWRFHPVESLSVKKSQKMTVYHYAHPQPHSAHGADFVHCPWLVLGPQASGRVKKLGTRRLAPVTFFSSSRRFSLREAISTLKTTSCSSLAAKNWRSFSCVFCQKAN